ncbi:TPA: GNAT family N-acetyltransferase [Streptococcus suis]
MEIRFAKFSDLEQILKLEQANFSTEEQISATVLGRYLQYLPSTCLVMEQASEIAGFLLACPTSSSVVSDDIFYLEEDKVPVGNHLAIASLVVSDQFKGQGVGTLLLAALKEVAVSGGFEGIALTCKEYLIKYYEGNQFCDLGPSQSQFGGTNWYDMYWKVQ